MCSEHRPITSPSHLHSVRQCIQSTEQNAGKIKCHADIGDDCRLRCREFNNVAHLMKDSKNHADLPQVPSYMLLVGWLPIVRE